MGRWASFGLLVSVVLSSAPAVAARHPLTQEDIAAIKTVSNPVCAPDGQAVVYAVKSTDADADKSRSALWLANWPGGEPLRLTAEDFSSSKPSFSPDGHLIAFLSSRGEGAKAQIYLLDRRGGEAQKLTNVSGEILDYVWSPDGRSLLIAMTKAEEAATDSKATKRPKPVVIDDYHFKQDEIGYLGPAERSQLFLFDLESKSLTPLSSDPHFDLIQPSWSPDGKSIAFIADHRGDRDAPNTQWLYLIEPHSGAEPRLVSRFNGIGRQKLVWLEGGKRILHSIGEPAKFSAYAQNRFAITDLASGATSVVAALDRPLSDPLLAADGKSVLALVSDDRRQYQAVVTLSDGASKARSDGGLTITEHCAAAGHVAVIAGDDATPAELYALDGDKPRRLSAHNTGFAERVALGKVEDFAVKSADGADIHGLMVLPPDFVAGKLYPTILWVHGGPNGQDQHGLNGGQVIRQWLAAHGYVVLAVNYRGSSGRGADFSRVIAADWGNREVADLQAAANFAVERKIADPERLGIGGWSYGGILTDYSIASDHRYKAAISGAGAGNWFSFYGHDEYVLQYNEELGPPWRDPQLWLKLSYPFFHADRITTPTLFMGGTLDANVPIIGGEQMYQALKTLGIESELVAYPGEYHGLKRPSFLRDRMERLVAWYDRYLKAGATE